ncbi:hypothetical protein AVEN_247474-1, partial [Araneus ventricosus]
TGNYAFGRTRGHATGATFRKEAGSHGVVDLTIGYWLMAVNELSNYDAARFEPTSRPIIVS